MRIHAALGIAAAIVTAGAPALAGTFDAAGDYHASEGAAAFVAFDAPPERYVPDDAEVACQPPQATIVQADDALEGGSYAKLATLPDCLDRFTVTLTDKAAYRFSVWMRHGGLDASVVVLDATKNVADRAVLGPTGRTTSDGWVELASNALSIDPAAAYAVYLRAGDYASADGIDVDAFEVIEDGAYREPSACSGVADPVCGADRECFSGRCVEMESLVPAVPADEVRAAVVDGLEAKLDLFFGGRRTRLENLPKALDDIGRMRKAKTPWQFWGAWVAAIHHLRDWHTNVGIGQATGGPMGKLNACFIEGDADASHAQWPKDPRYWDVLVSHVGQGSAGLAPGDRLVAVDGLHPFEWASHLAGKDPGFHAACDPDNFADFAEELGGGGGLILRYARTITVIHCHGGTGTCDEVPETIAIADLAPSGGQDVACDNRPSYHLVDANELPNPDTHFVYYKFFRGRIADTTPEEAIFGMVWDTLYGGGDPNGYVNSHIADAIADFTANARGVILDHRAGNGGTLDAAENVTKLVRPKMPIAVIRMPTPIASWDGPETANEGVAIFNKFKGSTITGYVVGAPTYQPDLPVALILHRDGSASDYMPFGMKGAPKTKLFGPHATAGAFSTFIQFRYWDAMAIQFASGDTIAFDGQPLIGHGVEPDYVVPQRQSDVMVGKDTLHEAALAWVRQELQP